MLFMCLKNIRLLNLRALPRLYGKKNALKPVLRLTNPRFLPFPSQNFIYRTTFFSTKVVHLCGFILKIWEN